ncbi:MAG: YebC/PmpR family DNA-binding transcriptional regulator [Candidatus Omnitrophota bacterium]|nr:MAG: YebC/PmpR family DNA-binding transcriptional regulator [Candidatus Omnitrophota bacterium]
MSGHSKWASIKHKKGAADAKRGRLFTKLIREITVAARHGGGKPDANPRLRLAIQRAKDANMPQDNIDRAIKKGTGELEGVNYEEVTYEGYGPGGIAIMVEVLTDNKNRATSEIRNIFSKKGGNMAGSGSVNWIFQKKGYIVINKTELEEDKLMSVVLESGAEDLKTDESTYGVTTEPADFDSVKKALETHNVKIEAAEITNVPKNTIRITGDNAKKVLSLVNELEEQEDVQNVYANFDIPDEILKEME